MRIASGSTKRPSKKEMKHKRGISVLSLLLDIRDEIFFSSDTHKGWKYYQGIIHNKYHGGNIKTDRHVICLIPEDVEKKIHSPSLPPQCQGR